MQPMVLVQPRTLDAAIESLARYGEDGKVVAGATALTILLRKRLIRPSALISIGELPGLDKIELDDGYLRLGALVTHRAVELSPLVRRAVPVLAQTFGVVANVRVRNAATVGGVLAEGDYASDPPPVFLALNAEIETFGPGGSRVIPIKDFFVGFYETALDPHEILTAVRVPVPQEGTRAVYQRYVTRSMEDRPCIGVAAVVRMTEDGEHCAELRVTVGAASEVPRRFPDVEELARDTDLGDDVLRKVADGYAKRIDTLADMRGSAWYRTEMIRVWVRRAITAAAERAPRSTRNGPVNVG